MGIYQRGQKYYIDYRFQGRRIRECAGFDRDMAEKALVARKGEIVQERFQLAKMKHIRFDIFAKQYMDCAKTDKRSWERDERLLKKLTPFFGDRVLNDISPFLIESYKKKRLEEVKPATVNREIALLKHMYNLAIRWRKASHNPMMDVRLLREEPFQERVLSPEEITKILAACTEYSRPVVLAAIHTGMRLGEILSLRWRQVDLKQRVITLTHTKNGRLRKVPINDTLFETLKALKEKNGSEFVYTYNRTGKPVQKFQTAWLAALRRAGVPRCRFHDLRHTFASHLVAAGVDLVTVKELLGHSNIITTMRYAHSAPEQKKQAVAVLNERFSAQDGHKLVTKAVSLSG